MPVLGALANRVGIDPQTLTKLAFATIERCPAPDTGREDVAIIKILADQREEIIIDKIIILRFEIEIIGTDIEVERTIEIGLQPQFLGPLPIARPAKIDRREAVGRPELRVGVNTVGRRPRHIVRQAPNRESPQRVVEQWYRDEPVIIL